MKNENPRVDAHGSSQQIDVRNQQADKYWTATASSSPPKFPAWARSAITRRRAPRIAPPPGFLVKGASDDVRGASLATYEAEISSAREYLSAARSQDAGAARRALGAIRPRIDRHPRGHTPGRALIGPRCEADAIRPFFKPYEGDDPSPTWSI